MNWDDIKGNEKKRKKKRKKKAKAASSQQPAIQQYTYQNKIQPIVPNTFTNTESITQEDSLHNLMKKFISYLPLNSLGGGGY